MYYLALRHDAAVSVSEQYAWSRSCTVNYMYTGKVRPIIVMYSEVR